ncbi:hypothetical protein ABEW19_03450 [Paenibacillus illinoisensis]
MNSEDRSNQTGSGQPGKSWAAELWDWVKTIVVAFCDHDAAESVCV